MQTIINNNERKFLVQSQGFGNQKDIFCNLKDIPTVLKSEFQTNEEFKIYEFWNRKLKVCSKKHINEMFESNQVNFRIGKPLYQNYKFSFEGRKLGSIGVTHFNVYTVKDKSQKNAELALYKKFEHITDLKLVSVTKIK